MCGISGFYQTLFQSRDVSLLQRMIDIQNHRGPDSSGIYHNNFIGIGHNRLSLLDLSENGNQPFEDDEFVLAYNGEIYNFNEIKSSLKDVQWKSTSDTEVLFYALKLLGIEKTLSLIKGMFAFAYYNKKNKDLILCRDRFGIKPLFYGRDESGTIWFASELKAILSVSNFDIDDTKLLFSPLGILEKSNNYTAWKNIHIVPTGTWILVNGQSLTLNNYYRITNEVSENEHNRLDKAGWDAVIEEFDNLMHNSVSKMLISDAPIGAYVSGGIDSSLIANYASKQSRDFKLFTANIIGPMSEFSDAQNLAKVIDKPLYDYQFQKEMAIRDWVNTTWHYESPIVVHFNAIPFSNVSSLANSHMVKAVLTGEGSDELFLGYPKLLTKRYDKLIKFPLFLLESLYKSIPSLKFYLNKNEGNFGLLNTYELAVQGFARQFNREKQIACYDFVPANLKSDYYLSAQMMQEGILSLLWRNDRMGMIKSVEARFPFLDEDVVRFAMNLPLKYKIGRTNKFYNYKHPFLMDKAIVRKTAAKYLPETLWSKKKNGFPTYGLRFIKVNPKFFYDGIVANLFQLSPSKIDYMCKTSSQYHIALLASVEIWSKLFIAKMKREDVQNLVEMNISI